MVSLVAKWQNLHLTLRRWDYVKKHKVQLPDEYDRIMQDIEPLWGYPPEYLQKRQAEDEETPVR